jgi:YVTN family beta-propeller protein
MKALRPLIWGLILLGLTAAPGQAAPFAYIPLLIDTGFSAVSVIDTATNTVVATTTGFGSWLEGVAVHPSGTFVYLPDLGGNTVLVLDTATNTVVATVPVGSSPLGVAVALAHRLAHPFTLAFALNWAACVHRFLRDKAATRTTAEAVIRIAAEHGFAQRVATGTMLLGWASAADARDRIDQIREGLLAFEATGARIGRQDYLALLAEACAEAGRPDEARAVVGQALEIVQACGERMYEAELYRLDGEFLLAESPGGPVET